MNARVRVMLTDEQGTPFAGIGVIRLLKAIDEHGSINHAAKVCGLSYLKAWTMMNRLDEQFDEPILNRTSGGPQGGGATLTFFGRQFLKEFEAYHQRVTRTAKTEMKRFTKRLALLFLCGVVGLTSCARAPDEPDRIHVAAAAALKYAMPDIIARFHEKHPEWKVEATYSSSGSFYAQLTSRAPFDIFFSADMDYPGQLIEEGHVAPEELFHYAGGRLVLWTRRDSPIDIQDMKMEALFHPSVVKIAIANPRHSPYGKASEAALQAYGVLAPNQAKLVHAQNIAQAAQFIESGAAQLGVIARSLAQAPALADRGTYWEIPADRYPPIELGGVIPPWTKHRELATAFRDFVLSDTGREILSKHGFTLPGDS